MKIIKHPPEFLAFQIDCGQCSALLEIETPADLARCEGGDLRESWDYAVARCPCCRCGIEVPRGMIPDHIFQTLKKA